MFSLRARPWLLWQVVLGRYDVTASASYRFLSIPKGPFVFYFSPWMNLSPSWKQPIDLMIKDCRLRRSEKSLFKTELFSVWFNNFCQDSKEIHLRKLQIFLRIFHREQDYLCVKKLEAALQIKQTNKRRQKLVEVCSLKFLLVLIRDISSNIHVEILHEIAVNVIWSVTTFQEVSFRHLTAMG